ncbi:hypothetical protein BaRGS_00022692 [Batillaria attramentaria]|uniref:AIG1-type G domain-containing protein n=1 Tax=Batillaria attramentaria TaxID=370345 RepID=A0ABD0KFT5_9CAEN
MATPEERYAVLVIGKTGTGKSTVCNIILGRPAFDVGRGMDQMTKVTQTAEATIQGEKQIMVKVTDTPDLINSDMGLPKAAEEVKQWREELRSAYPESRYHAAILVTIRCDVRYTAEEYAVYRQVKKLWGGNTSFCKRLVVVFTYGDLLDGKIEDQLKTVCPELQNVLKDAKQRYVVFSQAADGSTKDVRLVMIGKTGGGKSSTGNSILGEEKFPPVRGWSSGTEKCDWNQAIRNGFRIQITDTPGVCDTHRPQEEVHREIAKCCVTVTPGPHAVLMVFKAGDRFTGEEDQAYEELKELFGHELTKYMIVVFTGLDMLKKDKIELGSALQKAPPKIGQIIKEANGRYIGFDNEMSWEERAEQGDKLLAMVTKLMVDNRGTYYSNDLMKKFEDAVQERIDETNTTREDLKKNTVEEKEPSWLESVRAFVRRPFERCHWM